MTFGGYSMGQAAGQNQAKAIAGVISGEKSVPQAAVDYVVDTGKGLVPFKGSVEALDRGIKNGDPLLVAAATLDLGNEATLAAVAGAAASRGSSPVSKPVAPPLRGTAGSAGATGVAELQRLVGRLGRDRTGAQCVRRALDTDSVLRGEGPILEGAGAPGKSSPGALYAPDVADALTQRGTLSPEAAARALRDPVYGSLDAVSGRVPEGGTAIVAGENAFAEYGHVFNVVKKGGQLHVLDATTGTGTSTPPPDAKWHVFGTGQVKLE